MATQPKSNDAADAALSAIEEALNLGPVEPVAEAKSGATDKPLKLPEVSADELSANASERSTDEDAEYEELDDENSDTETDEEA